MFSKFEIMVALRYLQAKRKEGFISITALFSLIGIALGVATLIVVMSVMNGFRQELLSRILGINGHVNVGSYTEQIKDFDQIVDDINTVDGVKYTIPMIDSQVMLSHRGNAAGAMVKGMRLEDIKKKNIIAENIKFGYIDILADPNTIIIGKNMAINMGVRVGDTVQLISPKGNSTIIGMVPRIKTYTVGALFEVGMYEYDSTTIFMPLESAQKYFKMRDKVNKIEVTLEKGAPLKLKRAELDVLIDKKYYVNDWQDLNSSFFNALDVERSVMFLILTLIILIAAFNIISSLIMLVNDKGQSIAILRTIGATRAMVIRVFFLCGASVGLVGTLIGTIIGISFASNIQSIQRMVESITGNKVFDPVVYFLSELPSEINYNEVLLIVLMSLFLSLSATLYPSFRAAKIHPAQALKNI
ncbi:MAG: lipoprotein-releasing ABC transporter permease subunit [Rickettsiales bacterium]|nr:lipoprotein-releasing ABC transporter permease subunit [Rickettsiales bacterium]